MTTLYFPELKARVLLTDHYKPGDQAPDGYLEWHAWAEVQHKAGLRQVPCPTCCKWRYPQQLSTIEKRWTVTITKRRRFVRTEDRAAFLCLKCAEQMSPSDAAAVERAAREGGE